MTDPIKEAFQKIKQDIDSLREETTLIREGLLELSDKIRLLSIPTDDGLNRSNPTDKPTDRQTQPPSFSPQYALKGQENPYSTGNRGVPTDRQTNQQTDRHIIQTQLNDPISEFKRANEVLSSLDSIKKEIRAKFKGLTPQEMVIFAQIYTLEGKNDGLDYKTLAETTQLSESSIRDYVNKLIKKGIPINKIKQNNKKIILKVSQDLKNIATLDTILQLRNI